MKTSFRIAWRFLVSAKGQSLLIAIGIAVGVSVQVFIGSLISGLQIELVDTAIGRTSQITVKSEQRGELIGGYGALIQKVQDSQPDALHVSAAADASGFLNAKGADFPVLMRGLQLPQSDGIYRLGEAKVSGDFPKGNEVMLGTNLMKEAGVALYDTVSLATPQGSRRDVRVSGIFDLKTAALNTNWVIADLGLVQGLFSYGDKVTSIEMQAKDPFKADTMAEVIKAELPSGLKVENWKAQNETLLSGLNGQSISSLMIQIFVLVSVVLAIASVLAISVLQKSKQLGILKAMGIKDRAASLIFLAEGFLLGIAGAVLGVALGLGLALAFTKFALNPDGTPVIGLYLDPGFIGLSALVAVLSATLASLIPARRSARLDPMEVIKNG